MKRTTTSLLAWLCLTMLVALPLHAQAEKFAYVDGRRLLEEAPQAQDEIKILEQIFGDRNQELQERIESFNAQESEMQKNAEILSVEERQNKVESLRGIQRTLQREQQNYNEDYARSRNQGLARLEKLIFTVIIELADQEDIDLVIQQAVYASRKIDFTDKVLEELKKRYQQQ